MSIVYKKIDPSTVLPKEGTNRITVLDIVRAQPVNLQNFPEPVHRVLITFESNGKKFCNSFLLTGTNTKLEKLITATLGRITNKTNLLEMKGKTCHAQIIHSQTKDGRIFAELSEIFLEKNEISEESEEDEEFEEEYYEDSDEL